MNHLLIIILSLLIITFICRNKQCNEQFENNNLTILNLVLYSDSKEYNMMYSITSNFYKKFKNVKTIYYKFSNKFNNIQLENDILHIPGNESYIPGILDKTIKAFTYVHKKYNYDYVIRSNISTIINFDFLISHLIKNPSDYCGGLLNVLSWQDVYSGIKDDSYYGLKYISGTAIILSNKMFNDFMTKIYSNPKLINYDIIDDVSIGILIKKEFPNIEPCTIGHFTYVDNDDGINDNINTKDTIFYRNRCYDRMEDIINMTFITKKLS